MSNFLRNIEYKNILLNLIYFIRFILLFFLFLFYEIRKNFVIFLITKYQFI